LAREARREDRRDRRTERKITDVRELQDALETHVQGIFRLVTYRTGPAKAFAKLPDQLAESERLVASTLESWLRLNSVTARIHDAELRRLVDELNAARSVVMADPAVGEEARKANRRVGSLADQITRRCGVLLDGLDAELERSVS
jgi:hypothetical protein